MTSLSRPRLTVKTGTKTDMEKKMLSGKTVLLLSPAFFGYERIIQKKMEDMGARVFYYDERSVRSSFSRALLKICPELFRLRSDRYYRKIIRNHFREKIAFILVVKCDMLSSKMIGEMKEAFPEAKLCLHLWDSKKNIKGIDKKIGLFDYASSFDRGDCDSTLGLCFRPLFFADQFRDIKTGHEGTESDLCFCGTIHSDRYRIIRSVKNQCEEKNLHFSGFFYLQSRFIYDFYKLTKPEFRDTTREDFSFEKLTQSSVAKMEEGARAVLDIQHPAQTGLTMRTIEMIGLQKKIVTTNQDIVNYDFFDEANICVIDRESPQICESFFSIPYKRIDENIIRHYSLEQWIADVLGMEETLR